MTILKYMREVCIVVVFYVLEVFIYHQNTFEQSPDFVIFVAIYKHEPRCGISKLKDEIIKGFFEIVKISVCRQKGLNLCRGRH